MNRFLLILCVIILLPTCALASAKQPLLIDLASDHIDIGASFHGAELVLFGIKRIRGDVAIIIKGPARTTIVRKKVPVMGIWMNGISQTFKDIPTYYNYALSRPHMSLGGQDLDSLIPPSPHNPDSRNALISLRKKRGLFPQHADTIDFLAPDVFRVRFALPAALPTGAYEAHALILREDRVVAQVMLPFKVAQIGAGAQIVHIAHAYGFIYGVICIVVAMVAGYGVSILSIRR